MIGAVVTTLGEGHVAITGFVSVRSGVNTCWLSVDGDANAHATAFKSEIFFSLSFLFPSSFNVDSLFF